MAKQYKLKFKPTPISRLLRRPSIPFPMVGYPRAQNWDRYYRLNLEFVLKEKAAWDQLQLDRAAAKIQHGEGPFVDDYGYAEVPLNVHI